MLLEYNYEYSNLYKEKQGKSCNFFKHYMFLKFVFSKKATKIDDI